MSTDLFIESQHGALPVLDLNLLIPEQETISMKLGDKPENIDLASVRLGDRIIDVLLAGNIDPLEFAVRRRILNDALEVAFKDKRVKELMVAEINKYGKGETPTRLGATISLTPRTSYDYAKDPEWKRLSVEKLEPAKLVMKAQEELIKTACKTGKAVVDQDTGQVIAASVPSSSTESVTVSLKKKK